MTREQLWRVICRSVRGASHVRADLPNQDAITWRPDSREGPPLILVVSDGHGSARSFRSDRGSRYAVAATADLMHELVSGQPSPQNLSMVKRVAVERLPTELVRRWRMAVDDDLAKHPFTEAELAKLAQQRGEKSRKDAIATPRLAYGATVLGVLVTQDFLLFLQLGDGDILAVADDGIVTRPLARDARLIANETTSLCMDDAWREVRLRFQANYGGLPALIMASTDGYANSFVNDDAFRKVGSDILAILREDGVSLVEESLPEWLHEASATGSGDDISLGILYRVDAVRAGPEAASADAVASDQAVVVAPLAAAIPELSSDGARPVTAPAGGDVFAGDTDDPKIKSRLLARLKHDGPNEPSKHGKLTDAIGDGDGAPASATSSDVAEGDV